MILVTPASNIGDFSPFKSEPSSNLSSSDLSRVDSLRQAAAIALEEEHYRRAVAIACSPATPAPSTTTLAGLAEPAEVIIKGKKRP